MRIISLYGKELTRSYYRYGLNKYLHTIVHLENQLY